MSYFMWRNVCGIIMAMAAFLESTTGKEDKVKFINRIKNNDPGQYHTSLSKVFLDVFDEKMLTKTYKLRQLDLQLPHPLRVLTLSTFFAIIFTAIWIWLINDYVVLQIDFPYLKVCSSEFNNDCADFQRIPFGLVIVGFLTINLLGD